MEIPTSGVQNSLDVFDKSIFRCGIRVLLGRALNRQLDIPRIAEIEVILPLQLFKAFPQEIDLPLERTGDESTDRGPGTYTANIQGGLKIYGTRIPREAGERFPPTDS